eukprot:10243305-Lingulodinium_polyedra.AAC.1
MLSPFRTGTPVVAPSTFDGNEFDGAAGPPAAIGAPPKVQQCKIPTDDKSVKERRKVGLAGVTRLVRRDVGIPGSDNVPCGALALEQVARNSGLQPWRK